jgi:ubiquinone biosynthesis O-methyltransferase
MGLKFTGEYFIPGISPQRIEEDHLARYHFAAKYVRNNTVLDISCGTGYGSQILAEAGAKIVEGVDILEDVIDYAKAHYQKNNLNFKVGDVCSLVSATFFDVIVSFESIEHVEDRRAMLANLHGLLKINGLLIISTPNRLITSPMSKSMFDKPKNKFHLMEFSIQEFITELTISGFRVDEKSIYGQRFRKYIPSALLAKVHKKFFRPDYRTSPDVIPVAGLMPRYIIIVAEKK